jgi:hypothetical protein
MIRDSIWYIFKSKQIRNIKISETDGKILYEGSYFQIGVVIRSIGRRD